MNHGILICGVPPNHHYEFWWMGERLDIAGFNERLMNATREIGTYVHGIREGMDLAGLINGGTQAVIELDLLEEVLNMPLCETCRLMIANRKS